MKAHKKGQIAMPLIAGIAGLIILVIVSFLIVDTLNSADLLSQKGETVTNGSTISVVNETGVTISAYSTKSGYSACLVTACRNSTDGVTVPTANYTISGCNVRYSGPAGDFNNTVWKCDYSYSWDGDSQVSVNTMIGNYTQGIDNVSDKLPTILLVAAVILLFGAIVLLVQKARETTGATGGSL
jgi:hypothetical protein